MLVRHNDVSVSKNINVIYLQQAIKISKFNLISQSAPGGQLKHEINLTIVGL